MRRFVGTMALWFLVGSNAAIVPAVVPVVIPAAHAMAVGLAGLHTAAVASFHAAAGAKLAGAALHAAGSTAAATSTAASLATAPAALFVNAPAGTRVLTDYMRGHEKPSTQAVGRTHEMIPAILNCFWISVNSMPHSPAGSNRTKVAIFGLLSSGSALMSLMHSMIRRPASFLVAHSIF